MQPCPECPFRVNSPLGYDDDAISALDDDNIPSCHVLVGMDSIFHENLPDKNRCQGYELWMNGESGYAQPKCTG